MIFKAHCQNSSIIRVSVMVVSYWVLINIVLFSLLHVMNDSWKIINGFNLGACGSLLGFLIIALTSKWFFSPMPLKQLFAYFVFFFRMGIYGLIVGLALAYNFFNLFSLIGGFSLIMVGTLTSELLVVKQRKKAQVKC